MPHQLSPFDCMRRSHCYKQSISALCFLEYLHWVSPYESLSTLNRPRRRVVVLSESWATIVVPFQRAEIDLAKSGDLDMLAKQHLMLKQVLSRRHAFQDKWAREAAPLSHCAH